MQLKWKNIYFIDNVGFEAPWYPTATNSQYLRWACFQSGSLVLKNTSEIHSDNHSTNSLCVVSSFPFYPNPVKCCCWHQAKPRRERRLLHALQPNI